MNTNLETAEKTCFLLRVFGDDEQCGSSFHGKETTISGAKKEGTLEFGLLKDAKSFWKIKLPEEELAKEIFPCVGFSSKMLAGHVRIVEYKYMHT